MILLQFALKSHTSSSWSFRISSFEVKKCAPCIDTICACDKTKSLHKLRLHALNMWSCKDSYRHILLTIDCHRLDVVSCELWFLISLTPSKNIVTEVRNSKPQKGMVTKRIIKRKRENITKIEIISVNVYTLFPFFYKSSLYKIYKSICFLVILNLINLRQFYRQYLKNPYLYILIVQFV